MKQPLQENVSGEYFSIQIPAYKGDHPVLKEVVAYFEKNRHPALTQVLVFGSLADETWCNYSDFDGLIVIDPRKITDASSLIELRSIIKKAEKFLFLTDALQHHGWLIHIEESSECPVPLASIMDARALFPQNKVTIRQAINKETDNYIVLKKTIASIVTKLQKTSTENCLFEFKTLCSEFMLLPALSIQASTGTAISKKDSFSALYINYPSLSRNAMATVSKWRSAWTQPKLNTRMKLFHFLRRYGIRLKGICPEVGQKMLKEYRETWKSEAIEFCNELSSIVSTKPHQR